MLSNSASTSSNLTKRIRSRLDGSSKFLIFCRFHGLRVKNIKLVPYSRAGLRVKSVKLVQQFRCVNFSNLQFGGLKQTLKTAFGVLHILFIPRRLDTLD